MIRLVVIGMGPIGLSCAKAAASSTDLQLVGLVDLAPAKKGKSLSQLEQMMGQPANPGAESVKVTDRLEEVVAQGVDVAIVTTSSQFDVVAPMLKTLLDHKIAVVSSCEEMIWPWYRHEALANQIDAYAKQAGRAILGTGVNPGFVMDSLAVVLACMVRKVTAVRCERRVEAALRRQPLQAKIGATMKPDKFYELAKDNKIGHQGIAESVALLAAGLGHKVTKGSVQVTLDPVIAQKPLNSALGLIEPGSVAGIHNVAKWENGTLSVELDLTMAVGTPNPHDAITLEGPVTLSLEIKGGLPGDSATVAVLLNEARMIHTATPGLRTMLDMPPAGCRG